MRTAEGTEKSYGRQDLEEGCEGRGEGWIESTKVETERKITEDGKVNKWKKEK